MSDIFSAAGSVAAAAINANAIREATQSQIEALNRQRQFVYENLDPSVIGPQATQADVNRAQNRLALQGQIDPALLSQRYASEAAIADQASKLGIDSTKVSDQTTKEALAGTPGMEQAKDKLVSAAMDELNQGATLPPDVQAELVKAGLERSGQTTGSASGRGTGGQILRTILGTAGLQLKQQRQQHAAGLITTAQNLDSSRQNILQSLFPRLSQTQLANLGGQQNVLTQSNSMVPEAGLSGSDIANIWLARVGATNQLAQSAADAAARGAMGQGQMISGAVGGGIASLPSAYNQVSGWFGGSPGLTQSDLTPTTYGDFAAGL